MMIMSKIYIEKEIIEKAYNKHLNIVEAAREIGISKNTFARLMKDHRIESVGSQGARKNNLNHYYFDEIDTEEKGGRQYTRCQQVSMK